LETLVFRPAQKIKFNQQNGLRSGVGRLLLRGENMNRATQTKQITQTTQTFAMTKRIGNTVFEVCGHFSPTSTVSLEEKIMKLVENDLTKRKNRGKIESPQTSRLSEMEVLNA
jgi:hypothetical protein